MKQGNYELGKGESQMKNYVISRVQEEGMQCFLI